MLYVIYSIASVKSRRAYLHTVMLDAEAASQQAKALRGSYRAMVVVPTVAGSLPESIPVTPDLILRAGS